MARQSATNAKWLILEIGEQFEGYFMGSSEKDQGSRRNQRILYFESEDGERFQMYGSTVLNGIFCGDGPKGECTEKPVVKLGTYVWVSRLEDKVQNSKGLKYDNPLKFFSVDFDNEVIHAEFANNKSANADNVVGTPMREVEQANPDAQQNKPTPASIPASVAKAAEPTDEGGDDLPW
jgi:hypothetical protein